MKNLKVLLCISFCIVSLTTIGCSNSTKSRVALQDQTNIHLVAKRAPIPEGVIEYCWEEPLVKFEEYGPGVDTRGHWYHPAYTASHEVKLGRWRPCQQVESEKTLRFKKAEDGTRRNY